MMHDAQWRSIDGQEKEDEEELGLCAVARAFYIRDLYLSARFGFSGVG
jgi:hypothetical protein